MVPQHRALPVALFLSLALPVLLFFSSSLKPQQIWAFPRVCFWGHISISPFKRNLQHLLLSQPLELSERENTGYWEVHGLFAV